MANVHDILAIKGLRVHTVGESVSALDAVQLMNAQKIGALVVTRGSKVAGMFTERDVLSRIVAEGRDPAKVAIKDVMTSKVVCCHEDTPVKEVASLMKSRRIRHLPVVDEHGSLCGMVSIGDINSFNLRDSEVTIQYMSEYIYGRA